MATTRAILTDRIRRILSGGWPSDRDRVKDAEISQAIGDCAGALLKLQTLDTNFNFDGETTIDGALIATYESIPVTRGFGLTARVALPVAPMILPERMGVFSVYPSGEPELEFYPVPAGMYSIWSKEKLVSPLSAKLYSTDSKTITIYDDLVGAGVVTVDLKLCVMDIDAYGENEILPLSSDMVNQLVDMIVKQFSPEPMTTRRETDMPSPSKADGK